MMVEVQHPGGPGKGSAPGHELSDLKPRAIAIFLLVLAVMIVGVLVVSVWVHNYSASRLARTDVALSPVAKPAAPPEPRLQVFAPKETQEFRAREDDILKNYGWVNREAGLVRIPIDRAIQLLAERGLPVAAPKAKRPAVK
jgi:hypothetical protein